MLPHVAVAVAARCMLLFAAEQSAEPAHQQPKRHGVGPFSWLFELGIWLP